MHYRAGMIWAVGTSDVIPDLLRSNDIVNWDRDHVLYLWKPPNRTEDETGKPWETGGVAQNELSNLDLGSQIIYGRSDPHWPEAQASQTPGHKRHRDPTKTYFPWFLSIWDISWVCMLLVKLQHYDLQKFHKLSCGGGLLDFQTGRCCWQRWWMVTFRLRVLDQGPCELWGNTTKKCGRVWNLIQTYPTHTERSRDVTGIDMWENKGAFLYGTKSEWMQHIIGQR